MASSSRLFSTGTRILCYPISTHPPSLAALLTHARSSRSTLNPLSAFGRRSLHHKQNALPTSPLAWLTSSSLSSPLAKNLSSIPSRGRSTHRFFTRSTPLSSHHLLRSHSTIAASSSDTHELPRITSPSVSTHLYLISGLVFAIVVVGGLTRLTESGLSITEWNLVTGTLPPLSAAQWQDEYQKYMVSPEGTLLNKGMSIDEFKSIYVWEWGHRLLGRVIGLAFLAPIPYWIYKKKITKPTGGMLFAIATLIGGQGALGWYMVKSGLTHEAIQARDGVPRVSQYRLAAHLGMAFLVYSLALRHAIGVRRDWIVSKGGDRAQELLKYLGTPQVRRLKLLVHGLTGLVFLTAISGAFVAGLDAGLLYNTFPYMGETIVPPISELYSPKYSRSSDGSDLYIRNSLENPTTVQFDHRVLATTTFSAIVGLFLFVRRPAMAAHIPKSTYKWLKSTMHMAFLQVTLGISTLVYLVPIPLAAAHQAGSLVLLSLCVAAGASLRTPSRGALKWLEAAKGAQRAGKMPAHMSAQPRPSVLRAGGSEAAAAKAPLVASA